MKLILQTANVVGDEKNCLYPNRAEISSAEELQEAVKMDHVCAEYQEDAASITVNTSGTIVTNPGSVYAEPILTVYGSGDITLMVGSTIVELEDISGSILLDCALKEAYP